MDRQQKRKLGKFLLVVGLSCAVYAGASIGFGIVAEVVTTSPGYSGDALISLDLFDDTPAEEWVQWARWFTVWGFILAVCSAVILYVAREVSDG